MIIKITSYDGIPRVVSFAKSEYAYGKLTVRKTDTVFLGEGKLSFFPDNISIGLTADEFNKFSEASDFDVFEIDAHGNAFKYFDNSSPDNAIMVTNKCNSNCVMCPTPELIRQRDSFVNIDYLTLIASHFPKDAEHITITGGEPFLAGKDIFGLLEYLKCNFPCTSFLILTNGRVFSIKEYADLALKTQPRNTIFGIPLHGYNASTHDSITQSDGSFRQTYIGLKNLLSRGIKVELRLVVSKLNMDFITDIARLIAREFRGAQCVKIMGLEMTGNAAKHKDSVWISYEEAFNASRRAIGILMRAGIDVGLYNFPLCSVDKGYRTLCEKSISQHKIRFADKCSLCKVKDACGGMFSGTVRLSKDDVKPVLAD